MCGIVGYVGRGDAVPILLDGLKRLEYRGYDSAGIGVIRDGRLEVRRRAGKVVDLARALAKEPLAGAPGVAHTRWATHGKPSDRNAHPHRDCSRSLAVVHNGIIENASALRRSLQAEGHAFESETDTEVIAHLIERAGDRDLEGATARAVAELRGAFALGIISEKAPGQLLAVRRGGAPLVVGAGADGMLLASDISAMLDRANEILVLEDGEMAVLSREGVRVTTLDGTAVRRPMRPIPGNAEAAEKRGYPHFMLKEIYEQPRAIAETWRTFRFGADGGGAPALRPGATLGPDELGRINRVVLIACGTSWHAALVGKYLLEALGRIPVEVDVASEFRYREPVVDPTTLVLAISQSGETADTLAAGREAKSRGSKLVAICNVAGSSISRDADAVIYTRVGPEIGVASTKAFTSQLAALYLFAIHLGRARSIISVDQAARLQADLLEIPPLADRVLARADQVAELARKFSSSASFLYVGRGINYPLALEGALKLKEVSYIHAEGYPAGEMKHGPIALVDETMPVVAIAPRGRLYEKVLGTIEEIKARNGIVIALASDGDEEIGSRVDHVLSVPTASELLLPLLLAIPLQLLAYHIAVLRGGDVDQPRNLAKSVTVE
jgi:glucosamine--fructose-6-phosphate aminotransferase (isomerizing)